MMRLLCPLVMFAAALGIGLGQADQARAGLLPVNVTVTQDSGNYRYSYGVVLTSDSMLRSGDYFTIYDFQGLVGGTNTQPDGFAFGTSPLGSTPGGIVPSDNPALENLTWTYNGPDTLVGQQGLGNFMVQSQYGVTQDGMFSAQTHREVDGQVDANITQTSVPVPAGPEVPGVPEPASLALIGIGLPLVGLLRARRRS